MAIKAVGFDIDGTLYPNLGLYALLAPEAARNLRFLVAFGRVRRELRELTRAPEYRDAAAGLSGPEALDGFRRFQASLAARRLSIGEDEALATIDAIVYRDFVEVFARVRSFPRVDWALATLKASGLKLGALSDLPAARKLELMGLDRHFDAALSSEDTGFLKPSPEPFLELASRLGEKPEDIVYVGNSSRYDVEGARGVGMKTALVSRRKRRGADFVFTDYRALVDWIGDLRGSGA